MKRTGGKHAFSARPLWSLPRLPRLRILRIHRHYPPLLAGSDADAAAVRAETPSGVASITGLRGSVGGDTDLPAIPLLHIVIVTGESLP